MIMFTKGQNLKDSWKRKKYYWQKHYWKLLWRERFLKMILAKKTISLTKTSMIFDSWRRKKILLTKIVMQITLERKIFENDIDKENNIVEKNVKDICDED